MEHESNVSPAKTTNLAGPPDTVRLFRGRSPRMKNKLPKLGTPTASGYRCSKGFIRKSDKLVQQVFWLGSDPAIAVQRRSAIDDFARQCEPDETGRTIWTDDLVTEMKHRLDSIGRTELSIPKVETRDPVSTEQVFQPTPLPAPVQRFGLTLHEALDQFCDWLRSRNEVARKTNENNCHRVKSIKFHLPDAPLNTIGFDQLQAFRSIITARPPVRRQKDAKVKRTPRPISLMTTRNWLQVLGQAFKWFRKTGRWIKPAHLEIDDLAAVFFLSKNEIMRLSQSRDEKEKINRPKPTLTLAELAIYYKLAAPGQRLYLLMGVCLGWRQRQIADLRKSDFIIRNGEHFVKFLRTKTGVEGDLWLCPELATLLIERVAKTPPTSEDYALLTENNLPLVHLSGRGNDTDSIKLTWGGVRRRAEKVGCSSMPFDCLRRFAGQAVNNLGDPFLAQVFLAQVPESVLEKHYAGRGIGVGIGSTAFEKVHDVQKKVYAALAPMFEATKTDMQTLKQRMRAAPEPAVPQPRSADAA